VPDYDPRIDMCIHYDPRHVNDTRHAVSCFVKYKLQCRSPCTVYNFMSEGALRKRFFFCDIYLYPVDLQH